MLPNFDFETYSEAGYYWCPASLRWRGITKQSAGLPAVGAAAYAAHPSTEVLSLAYDLKDGLGPRLWIPHCPVPTDLFEHINTGKLLEAWNVGFEYWIWNRVCHARMGWSFLSPYQIRCAMAKAQAFGLPGSLGEAGAVINAQTQKDKEGGRLLRKFSIPRSPTKKDKRRRILPAEDPEDARKLYGYNVTDIKAESAISDVLPEHDLAVWQMDRVINIRGVGIDRQGVENCAAIVSQAFERYTAELKEITGGIEPSQVAKLVEWLRENGVTLSNLQAATVEKTLKREDIPAHCKRALEIRSTLGSASVKKLFAIQRRLPENEARLYDLFRYCGSHTGRWSGAGVQPQNLVNSGPDVHTCERGHYFAPAFSNLIGCPFCEDPNPVPAKWNIDAVEQSLAIIASRDLDTVEYYLGDAVAAVSGCLRGLFCAQPGTDLICSDFSAIEAVVLAALAGEEWRLEVFRTHGKIYEISAAKITGIPFEEFLAYKERTGEDHPKRKTIGKIAELASGYQGSVGAWKAFGADKYMTDGEIKEKVDAWRRESPNIVQFWYGLEDAAKDATKFPGHWFTCREIGFYKSGNVLYCRLPSGRDLYYHNPEISIDPRRNRQILTYEGYNSDYTKGPKGWLRMPTYGGKLAENVTQAVANDIQRAAMLRLERAGYPIVLHVHDEICSEVLEGTGSVEEFETIMSATESWFSDWPINVSGGWRGKRYRKG